MNLQSQAIYAYKKIKQHICILEYNASGEKVGDIENIIVKNFFEI